MINRTTYQSGFTIIELLVVIAIIGLLASIIMTAFNTSRSRGRDARRAGDMKQIQTALGFYYDKLGRYPDSDFQGCGGWDSTGDGDMISPLLTEGFIAWEITDPTINNSCGNYAYYRYSAGSYGCDSNRGAYFVLGVRDMESTPSPYPGSPGWKCSSRDWQTEFDWVTGAFEK